MSVKQFASQMKATIEDMKSKGTAAIYCDNLIAYLAQVQNAPEPEPTPLEIERYKAQLQSWNEASKHQHEGQVEMFRSTITAGQGAIKSSFLLNGGAAVAVLAFIAHLAQFEPDKVAGFAACLLPFGFGVLAISVTSGFTYLCQWFYSSHRPEAQKAGFRLNILCIVLGIASYIFFTWGLYVTYRALVEYV